MRCTVADIGAVQRIYNTLGMKENAYTLLTTPGVYVLMPSKDSLFLVVMESVISGVAHTHVLPERRGLGGIKDARRAVDWMFENTSVKEIHGFTPENMKGALVFNRLVGFKKCGVIPSSYEEDGILYDRIVYSLTVEQWRQR